MLNGIVVSFGCEYTNDVEYNCSGYIAILE